MKPKKNKKALDQKSKSQEGDDETSVPLKEIRLCKMDMEKRKEKR